MKEISQKEIPRLQLNTPDTVIYKVASKMANLSTELFEIADHYNDPCLRDEAFDLINRSRFIVREHLHLTEGEAE